jgi:CheY-like chemotaxis protein
MPMIRFPFAVRLVGFSYSETGGFAAACGIEREAGCSYFHLADDNLQDPDLYIVNATTIDHSVIRAKLPPSDVRPVLLVGCADPQMPYPQIERVREWSELFAMLDKQIEKRADALSRLEASDVITVPERRRRERLEDGGDAAEYVRMRRKLPTSGGILVIDKNQIFSDHLSELLSRYKLPVTWTDNEDTTVGICHERRIAVAMINTSMPEIDPYDLCQQIKRESCVENTVVIFLVSRPFVYDPVRAKRAGASGFLNKPLASHHLISVLKKFLPSIVR